MPEKLESLLIPMGITDKAILFAEPYIERATRFSLKNLTTMIPTIGSIILGIETYAVISGILSQYFFSTYGVIKSRFS